MRIARLGIAMLLMMPAGIAAAQQAQPSQPQSLADAARRSREQKKDQAKPARFWDNDSIPTTPGAVSVVGDANASSATAADDKAADSSTKGAAAAAPGSADASKNANATEAELNAAKEHLKQLTADLDLLNRQNDLDRRTYYGKPDYSKDTDGADNLKREQDRIESKKQEVADAQKKVDEAQAKLGAPSPPAAVTPSTNPN
jgi:DNA repair exonuclease SbcCD ATPase subunit